LAKTIDRQRFLLEIRLIMVVSALSQSSELLGESGDDDARDEIMASVAMYREAPVKPKF